MPRKPRKLRNRKAPLSEAMRYFLETGQYRGLRKIFHEIENYEFLQIFRLAKLTTHSRTQLSDLWAQHGAAVQAGWQLKGRDGLPWGSQFNDERRK